MYDPTARQVAARAPVSGGRRPRLPPMSSRFSCTYSGVISSVRDAPAEWCLRYPCCRGQRFRPEHLTHGLCCPDWTVAIMTETNEPVDYGTPRYVTSSTCHLLPIVNPRGGKRLDIYGPHKPIPAGAMTADQVRHLLDHGLIEHADEHGRPIISGSTRRCRSSSARSPKKKAARARGDLESPKR